MLILLVIALSTTSAFHISSIFDFRNARASSSQYNLELRCKRVITIKKMNLLENARKIREEVDELESNYEVKTLIPTGFEASPVQVDSMSYIKIYN